ncbi:hypothetical protein, partial [Pseudoalteromonas luteoviolacea]
GAGDSFGAGDSYGTRPDDFETFPMNERNPETGGFEHYGVLYIERDQYLTGNFEPYLSMCVRTNSSLIVGASSLNDEATYYDKYIARGEYGKYYPDLPDYSGIELELRSASTGLKQRINMIKYGTKFEFEGMLFGHGQYEFKGYVRAFYKGSERYDAEGCESILGHRY